MLSTSVHYDLSACIYISSLRSLMGCFVSVSKAAQLVGMPARELQIEIDKGKLPTVRGMIHIDDLADLHPDIKIEEADMVAWVAKIKDDSLQHATDKLVHELSNTELRELLAKAHAELAYQRGKNATYESLIQELRYSLKVLQKRSSEPNKIQSLIAWIDQKMRH